MTFDPNWFSNFMGSGGVSGSYAHPLAGLGGAGGGMGGMGGGLSAMDIGLASQLGPMNQLATMGGLGGAMGGAGGANPLALAQMGMGLMGQSKQQKPPPLLPAANIGGAVGAMQQVPQGNYFQNAMAQRMGPAVMNYGGLNRMRGVLG